MCVLIDMYGNEVIYDKEYKDVEDAIADLNAEFFTFTSEDHNLEYGVECWQSDDCRSAWARLDGKYRTWKIIRI